MSVLITTEILGDHPALTSVRTEENLSTSWLRSSDGLVGYGVYERFEITGEARFRIARELKVSLSLVKFGNKVLLI